MSTVTVRPGALVTFDPSDKRVIRFDFDQLNLADGATLINAGPSFGITIDAIKQSGPTALTFDNAALEPGSRTVIARFLATTASLGDRYRVSVLGKTSESPEQDKEYSIFVHIEDH